MGEIFMHASRISPGIGRLRFFDPGHEHGAARHSTSWNKGAGPVLIETDVTSHGAAVGTRKWEPAKDGRVQHSQSMYLDDGLAEASGVGQNPHCFVHSGPPGRRTYTRKSTGTADGEPS